MKRRRRKLPRQGQRLLLATAGLLVVSQAEPVLAQGCTGSPCTIQPGSYTQPFLGDITTSAPLTFTNNGSFAVDMTNNPTQPAAIQVITSGGNGANSSDNPAGNGSPSSTLSFTNNGVVTHSIPAVLQGPNALFSVYGASAGGNGGNYTNDNAKHDAGDAAAGNDAGMRNSAPITVRSIGAASGAPSMPSFGAALLVQSLGGNGGSVTRESKLDENDNPTYDGHNGRSGAAAGNAGLVNTATVTVNLSQPLIGLWYWGAAARSLGGSGGTGNQGTDGGAAGQAAVSNTGNVSVAFAWGAPPAQPSAPPPPPAPPPSALGGFAVAAISQGGNGNMSVDSGSNGGTGGRASNASVIVDGTAAPIAITLNTSNPNALASTPFSAALAAISLGGAGGAGYSKSIGGSGGASDLPSVTVTGPVTIIATGDRTRGILALSQGGAGGGSGVGQNGGRAGAGGASDSGATGDWINLTNTIISTTGLASAGVMAASLGGHGGLGEAYNKDGGDNSEGGTGGAAGSAAGVSVTISGGSITTSGAQSPGLVALAQGGAGGNGGNASSAFTGAGSGTGGAGGSAGDVSVSLSGTATITTTGALGNGNPAHGIFASSIGGAGGTGGAAVSNFGSGRGDGGTGGAAGAVTITLGSGVSVTTNGDSAAAVAGRSQGGAGGSASQASTSGSASKDGLGGVGGNAGMVTITSAASLTTNGQAAHGILAQSFGGAGGTGANGTGFFDGQGGSGGNSGTAGAVTITQSGNITTNGAGAIGIQAQSIGGGGGAGGAGDGSLSGVGGTGGAASDGATVSVTHSGSIRTRSDFALGILAQSIGGGGGNGGDSNTIFTSVGGSGSGGGNGGVMTATLAGGSIATMGRLAYGLVAQSIGGGGGNGGDASSTGVFVALSIGGDAAQGGAGRGVTVNATGGGITTQGSNAGGLLAQSVGGGGGAAGSAYALAVGAGFSAGTALGGKGGGGGSGGTVTLNLTGLNISTGAGTMAGTNANPVDAFGIHAQSIGGGGGIGGSAAAQAITLAVPSTPETPIPSAAISTAIGGSGGTAGNGNNVMLTMNGAGSGITAITTQGQGSHAILLQSIGGGGGAGGDSSAMSTTIGYARAGSVAETTTFSLNLGVALGGTAGGGGAGGDVTATIVSATQPAPIAITTYGDYANGLVAQSIGGGGGNGGIGSSPTANFGITNSANANLALGGRSGAGGAGGTLNLTINPQATIQTYGASAIGLVGQSIGGGGGTSQGGTLNLGIRAETGGAASDDAPTSRSANLTINLGTTGGSGGAGGAITTTMHGTIRTQGNDAAGVVLQSIGGGGGIGGSAGSDASSDNPVSTLTGLRAKITDRLTGSSNESYVANLSLGGSGGSGGTGGAITYSMAGSITTLGDWSHGLVTQSIGGGGGMGGVATSASDGASYSATVAVGGSGGAGGSGADVGLTFGANSRITTGVTGGTGYAAFGVLAQSIGGGGGVAADGSVASTGEHNIGGSGKSGSGGVTGQGGNVTVNGTANIVTRGDVALGMLLQSIGGGGGVAATGAATSASLAQANGGPVSGGLSLQVGGRDGASGSGGTVTINNATLNIATSGANAFGLLAQSIGGGGGFGFSPNVTQTATNTLGAQATGNGFLGNGGAVSMSIAGGSITTTGAGAHGIVAQSIGGGGGIAGLPSGAASLVTLARGLGSQSPLGSGGVVVVENRAAITTSGSFAHGMIVQSIGGGGGLSAQGSQLLAGTTSAGGGASTSAYFDVTQYAPIRVSGANSIGIFAQSVSPAARINDGMVASVTANAAIQGGGGLGAGIWTDVIGRDSLILVNAGASVSALSGLAIRMTGSGGAQTVNNFGTVTGSHDIGGGTFNNNGTLNAGPSLISAQLVNAGTLVTAVHLPFGVSTVSGDFTQRATGRLLLDADFSNRRSDVLVVAGGADLAGRVRPMISSVLPNVELPFLVVNGPVTGTIQGEQTAIFGYQVTRKGGTHSVSANADFTPAGYDLSRNATAVAGHLQAAWDAGGAGLGPLFAALGNLADQGGAGGYRAALRQVSPDSSLAPGARVAAGARAFANAAMSCPQFEGTTAMLTEGQCVWAGLTGRTAAQAGADGLSSFRLNSATWQLGGQRSLGGGWFLGGSLAYENARLSTTDGLNGGRGQAGFGAITTKYQTGPWLFAGAVFGGGGAFNSTRTITLPGFGSIARGSPGLSNLGAMLRGTYTIGREEFYLRPSMSLSLVHARSGAYRETGAGVLNLDVSSASSTVAALTPALELGGRTTLPNGMVMRLFTMAGVSLLSEGRWNQESRLVSTPSAAGRFASTVRTDQVVGRFLAGMQLFATDRLEMRLQYEGEYSSNLTGHGGSLAFAYRF